jgi:hypothetical protein
MQLLLTSFCLLLPVLSFGQNPQPGSPPQSASPPSPAYQPLRYDEDWSALRDSERRTDALDGLKYIPLNRRGWYVSIGGETRTRYEYYDNVAFGAGPQDDNGYLLQRYLLHADWRFGERVRVFTQLQSGIENGRNGGPRPTDENRLDLHQAFVDVKLDPQKAWTLRVGRSEIEFGSGRLVSAAEGLNVRRSFDGARLIYQRGRWWGNLMGGKLTAVAPRIFDDAPEPQQTYWGAAVARLYPQARGGAAAYYLGADRKRASFEQGAGREIRHTLGTRIWWTKQGWDANYELVGQWGSLRQGGGGAARTAAIRAWAVASDTGYAFSQVRFSPRLGLRADLASGDRNPRDTKLQSFNPLFPGTAWSGLIALIGPVNVMEIGPSLRLRFRESVTLTADSSFYGRQSLRDGLYGVAVNLQRAGQPSSARYVGNATGLRVDWRINRHFSYSLVAAHFFAGGFLKETPPGKDVDYFSTWLTFRF